MIAVSEMGAHKEEGAQWGEKTARKCLTYSLKTYQINNIYIVELKYLNKIFPNKIKYIFQLA